MLVVSSLDMENRAPRVGHKKSRNGCAQCKRRHVKCNEEKPCSNCVRHGVACSLAGGPIVHRDDAKPRRSPTGSSHDGHYSTASDTETTRSDYRGTSPLRNLTHSLDRTNRGLLDGEWLADLQLMHHFDKHVLDVLTDPPDLGHLWQQELPRLAFSTQYIMHTLLGLSALHKASLEPQNAQSLQVSAVGHLDQALVLYRQESTIMSAESAEAQFCFSCMVVIFAYAIPVTKEPIDAICEHFRLVQGIDATVTEVFAWVSSGAFAPMFNRSLQETMGLAPDAGSVVPNGMEFGLNHLDYLLGIHPMVPDERRICVLILAELKQVYSNILQAQGSTGVSLVVCWPKQDTAAFNDLLKRRVPQALIILAHFCVVLNILDSRWWLKGWPSRLLNNIVASLDERWKSWIEWPVQTVLTETQTSLLTSLQPTSSNDLI